MMVGGLTAIEAAMGSGAVPHRCFAGRAWTEAAVVGAGPAVRLR